MNRTKTAPASSIACAPGALAGGLARTRFFDGMFLTQADLENEQRYWRVKRRLTNRALGEGVVWGLRLTWNPTRHSFTLSPGYAIDCCGNDLVVECPLEITERQLWELADPSLRAGLRPDAFRLATSRLAACVVLQYVECPEEARPVHRDACSGSTSVCEPSRIRETARLLLVPPKSPPPKSPPELFWDELIAFRDSLPNDVRQLLFPPGAPTPPPPVPQAGLVPVELTVTVPGNPAASVTLQPKIDGAVTASALNAHQTPAANRPSGVVTFELRPSAGWGFIAGEVHDADRVVERVTPPVAMSMYWSLDVAVPPPGSQESMELAFEVDQLALEEMFGAHHLGHATLAIRGSVQVKTVDGGGVDVSVNKLTVETISADVVEGGGGHSCFADAVPWGWAIETANGPEITKVLVLSALYATLSEAIARGASPAWRQIAYLLYYAVWIAFFGVNPLAPVDDSYKQQLVGLLLNLYERWCAGFAYPGPRCSDEHHGVYLGCGALTPSGAFASFDMWTGRRYVLTGPLFTHWAGLFGVAPVDVIVGRFADAICCLAGQPAITGFPGRGDTVGISTATAAPIALNLGNRVVVADAAGVAAAASARGVPLRWVQGGELATRVLQLFARGDLTGPSELAATQIADGGSVAVLVPATAATSATMATASSRIRTDVATALRTGLSRVGSRARGAVTELAVAVAYAAPVSALVTADTPPAVAALAKRLDEKKVTVGRLLDAGADATLANLGGAAPDTATRDAADTLVDRGEIALDHATAGLARAASSGLGTGVTDPHFLERAATEVGKAFGGHLAPDLVKAAARTVATPK